jgi:hypothetical protein
MKSSPIKQWLRLNPAILGLSISGALLFILLMQGVLSGRFSVIFGPESPPGALDDLRIAIVHCLLAGYLPAAVLALLRGTRRTIEELEGDLISTEDVSHAGFAPHIKKRSLIVAGLLGMSFTVFTPFLTTPDPPWDPSLWSPEVWWHRLLALFIGWWAGWLVLAVQSTSAHISPLAARVRTVDLLDVSPWSPFVRQGLLTALIIVGVASIQLLMLVDPTEWPVVAVAVGLCLVLALLGLWLPVRDVHRRIQEVKEQELDWTRERIWDSKALLLDASAHGQVADLIAYYQLIDDAQEWPFRASTLVQVALFPLIPIVSWIGGLFIEGLLDRVLG